MMLRIRCQQTDFTTLSSISRWDAIHTPNLQQFPRNDCSTPHAIHTPNPHQVHEGHHVPHNKPPNPQQGPDPFPHDSRPTPHVIHTPSHPQGPHDDTHTLDIHPHVPHDTVQGTPDPHPPVAAEDFEVDADIHWLFTSRAGLRGSSGACRGEFQARSARSAANKGFRRARHVPYMSYLALLVVHIGVF